MTRHRGRKKPKPAQNAATRSAVSERPPLSAGRKLIFSLVVTASLVAAAAELVLSVFGVNPGLSEEDPLVGFSSRIPLFVEGIMPDGSTAMVTARNKTKFFNAQRFPKVKQRRTFRVFCMGGSTTYGRPYNDQTSFCGWLRVMLPVADPSRSWEVINAGGISYASHRVLMLMRELVRYEPDLFIVYSGHNEFLERRTYGAVRDMSGAMQGLRRALGHSRIFAVAKSVIGESDRKTSTAPRQFAELSDEVETLLDDTIGPEAYSRDDELRRRIQLEYRANLSAMVDVARSVGAQVMLVATASNLRDCSPFKSEHLASLSKAHRQYFQVLANRASELGAGGQWSDALSAIDQALALDDRHAGAHYQRGQALWSLQRYQEARKAFVRAGDEDVCPIRALTEMRSIVAEVAKKQRTGLVDFAALADGFAKHGTPGGDLFLDHVHPTIKCNRLLALAIMDAMTEQQIVHPIPQWGEAEIERVVEDVEGRIDQHAHGVALRNLAQVLSWTGKYEKAYGLALRANEMLDRDGESRYLAGLCAEMLGRVDEAVSQYRLAVDADPNHAKARVNLGAVLQSRGDYQEAEVHFRHALQVDPGHAKAHYNLGMVFSAQGRASDAAQSFRQAVAQMPDYAPAHHKFARALAKIGSLDSALEHLREAARLDPSWPVPLRDLAQLLATHPDPNIRDPVAAARLKEQASRLTGSRSIP